MKNIKDWKLWLAAFIAFLIIVVGFFVFTEGAKYQYIKRDGISLPGSEAPKTTEETVSFSPISFSSQNSASEKNETSNENKYDNGSSSLETEREKIDYYDIPLEDEDQDIVFKVCEQYSIPPEVILAMMWVESRFDSNAVGYSGELGYMQILPSPTGEYALSSLGISYSWDPESYDYIGIVLSDKENNIECSVYLMHLFLNRYSSLNQALMCYNSGEGAAQSLWSDGVYDTYYSTEVMNAMKELTKK